MEILEQIPVNLKYPDLRDEVIEHVLHLADPDYQARVWIGREYPGPAYYDDLSQTFEALEDLGALDAPDRAVGSYLRTSGEAEAFGELGACFDRLFERYGSDMSDAQYLATPEWTQLVSVAAALGEMMAQNEPK